MKALEFMDPQELVDEFARSIRLELDYGHEARNAEAFHRNFARDERVVVPRVIRQYSTSRILTLEFLRGTKVADLDLETMRPDERRDIAYRLADAWMTMVFRHGFFHSDPHPANIFVLESGALGLVDFGQAGKLTDDDMAKLTMLFVDAATENVDAIPRRLRELGVRYDPAREQEFRARAAGALRPLLRHPALGHRPDPGDPRGLPAHLLDEPEAPEPLRHPRQGDRDARVGRAGGLSGVQRLRGREAVRAGLLADRFHPRALSQRARAEALGLASVARDMPYQVSDVLEQLRQGTFQVHIENPGIDQIDDHIDQASNRMAVALIVAGGLLGSAIIGVFADDGPHVLGLHLLSVLGFLISGTFGLWLVWGVMRHGRL